VPMAVLMAVPMAVLMAVPMAVLMAVPMVAPGNKAADFELYQH
jgi:hypothetical protein